MSEKKENVKVVKKQLKEIKAIDEKYSVSVFHKALTSLMEVGINNFNDDYIKETIDNIMLSGSFGVEVVNAYELQGKVIRCFEELVKYPAWTLILYIKMYMDLE